MNYCSKIRIESTTTPGCTFVLHKMTELRRMRREIAIADLRVRITEKREALDAALKNLENEPKGTVDKLNAEFGEMLHAEWYGAWIRWGVHSIEGFEIDDQPATVSSLLEEGPTNLIEEIFLAVRDASGLSIAETKNSQPPGGSAAPGDGKTTSSTADSAAPGDGTGSEIAAATSQAT
jgi:hypothetical protein